MRSQTRAIIASVAVLAMLLTTVGGVTYSWFADEHSVDITTDTAKVSYDQQLMYDDVEMTAETISVGDTSTEHTLKVTVTNNGSMPVVYSSKFLAERYSAYEASTGYTNPKADYIMGSDGNLAQDTKGSWSSGFFQNNLQAFQVEIDGSFQSIGDASKPNYNEVYAAGMDLVLDETTTSLDVKLAQWWIANEDVVVMPGASVTMTFSLKYTKTTESTITYNSEYAPTVRFVSSCVQVDRYEAVKMTNDGTTGSLTGTIDVKASHAGYVFYDGSSLTEAKTRIVIGWDAIDIESSVGKTLSVSVKDGSASKEVTVSGDCIFKQNGRISYTLDLGTGVSSVTPMDIPMTVWKDSGNTIVSFSDSKDNLTHTVSYQEGTTT